MTNDIDAIRQREQAATPGPWHTWTVDPRPRYQVGTITPFRPVAEVYERDERGNDAEFIAAARTDVPTLLAKVDELTAALAERDAQLTAANRRADGAEADQRALIADKTALANENAELRTALLDVAKTGGVTHVWDRQSTDWVPVAKFAATKAEVAR